MKEETKEKKSFLESILDGVVDFAKRPVTIKRVKIAFESAANSLEEKALDNNARVTEASENFVKAAKSGGSLNEYVNSLITLEQEAANIKETEKFLEIARKRLFEVKIQD